ncbi:hypothetical protein LIER_22660 [Lithospermum erythrorhizon]|uniref:Uncharacterized protein n=1 Tax=Lithospermum erythrorhizon TaxID=34254 RepID=A0AAV3QXT5_LITER
MCSQQPTSWSKWLLMAEYCSNTNYHTSMSMSLFEVLYGYKSPHLSASSYLKDVKIEAREVLQQRRQITEPIKEKLAQAQNRIKKFVGKDRQDRYFQEGEWVYLKLQPYRQNYVSLRKHLKLSSKFYSRFQKEAKWNHSSPGEAR